MRYTNAFIEKVDNKKLAKAIGLKVERRVKDEAYDAAYEARIVSVAISRKKKLAIDAIAEVKKLIVEYKLTKGDIRGKAIKQLMGE